VLGVRAVPSALAVNVRVPKSEQLRRSFKCCARTPAAWCRSLPRPRATMYCNLSALSSLNALACAAPRFGAGHSPDLAVARSGVRSCLQVRGEIMHSQCPDPASMCWHRALSDLPRRLEALRRSRALAGVLALCWWKRCSLLLELAVADGLAPCVEA